MAACDTLGKPADDLNEQLATVSIRADRPLLITDADEVLFAFMAAFERHLGENGAYFDWSSYRLNGNIRQLVTREPLDNPAVKALLAGFFDARTRHIEPVPGAAEALAALARRLQVVVLSNVPRHRHGDRAFALARHGMGFPLIANEGAKGAAVAALAAMTRAPVFFIDDAPSHHADVAAAAAAVLRIHFVGNPRLAALIGPAEACHLRARDWPEIRRFIEDHLDGAGH
jgi:hypothetical protein